MLDDEAKPLLNNDIKIVDLDDNEPILIRK